MTNIQWTGVKDQNRYGKTLERNLRGTFKFGPEQNLMRKIKPIFVWKYFLSWIPGDRRSV